MQMRILALMALLAPWSALATDYAKVAIVGGESGLHDYDTPNAALVDLANWCGTPSATNPCLVKVLPGVYDLQTGFIVMQSYVDLEGAGPTATLIKGNSANAFGNSVLSFRGAVEAAARSITVENTGGGAAIDSSSSFMRLEDVVARSAGKAISIGGNLPARDVYLERVTASASGTGSPTGIFADGSVNLHVNDCTVSATSSGSYGQRATGIHTRATNLVVRDTTISAASTSTAYPMAVVNEGGAAELANVRISVSAAGGSGWGVQNKPLNTVGGIVKIDSSQIVAPQMNTVVTLSNTDRDIDLPLGAKTYVGATRLDGLPPQVGGIYAEQRCVASYNGAYAPVGATCQ